MILSSWAEHNNEVLSSLLVHWLKIKSSNFSINQISQKRLNQQPQVQEHMKSMVCMLVQKYKFKHQIREMQAQFPNLMT
jgi:hypothetical protein